MDTSSQDTVEFGPALGFAETFFSHAGPPLKLQFGAATHPGHVRSNNEDQYAIVRRRRSNSVIRSSLRPEEFETTDQSAYGLVIADGVGGARFGEVASRLALQTMLQLSSQATSWVTKLIDLDAQQMQERVEAYVQKIQETLRSAADADPRLEGMGTTWTSAHVMSPYAVVVHLGDSRAYLLRDRQLVQITRDETLAQAWIDAGADPDSVRKFRRVLLNGLGTDEQGYVAQIHQIDFGPGDQLLLCTDGLSDMISDEVILEELLRNESPQAACDALVRAALEAGGRDNVTVVIAAAAGA